MRLCFCVAAVMAVLLLSPPVNAETSSEKLKRAAASLRALRDFCLQTMKQDGVDMANTEWNNHIKTTWTGDNPCPKTGHPWTGVRCDTDFEEVQKLHLLGYDLYCNFTGFDTAALNKFDPSSLTGLTEVELAYNKFIGPFPQLFADLVALDTLEVSGNQFSGDISKLKFKSGTLQILALAGNSFSGEIPDLRNKPHLSEIDLTGNHFTGDFSSKLTDVPLLQILNLGGNDFGGPLPDLSGVKRLSRMNIENNSFTGTLPSTLGDLGASGNGVLGLNLANNHFKGALPPNIVKLKSLRTLDVSGNQLTGTLPHLHTLPHLEDGAVMLGGNDFDCPIPVSTRTSTLYDTATCTCKAGSKGAKDADIDGDGWSAVRCRDKGRLMDKCANSSRFTCAACNGGKHSKTDWATTCDLCPPGHFAPKEKNSRCLACSPGDFAGTPGMSKCSACPRGRFSNTSASDSCEQCAAGYVDNSTESTSCQACQPGWFQPDPEGKVCVPVPAGSFANGCADVNKGCRLSTKCPNGTYTATSKSTECKQCEPGQFAGQPGSKKCEKCEQGFFSTPGASMCNRCMKGKFQKMLGSTKCVDCPAGYFAPDTNAAQCQECPEGRLSGVGAVECDMCAFGRYTAKKATKKQWIRDPRSTTPLTCTPEAHSVSDRLACQAKAESALVHYYQHAMQLVQLVPFTGDCVATGRSKVDKPNKHLMQFLVACTKVVKGDVVCVDVVCDGVAGVGVSVKIGFRGSPTNIANVVIRLEEETKSELVVPPDAFRSSPTTFTVVGKGTPVTVPDTTQHLCAVAASCDHPVASPSQDWVIYKYNQCEGCPGGTYQDKRGKSKCETCKSSEFALTSGPAFVGLASCKYCADGQFNNGKKESGCDKCAPGKFSTGGEDCQPCSVGEYSTEGSAACTACGTFTYIVADGNAHTVCNAFLTRNEAIVAGIIVVVVFIIAFLIAIASIVYYYKNRQIELADTEWMFMVDEKGVGHWYNEESMKISYSRPEHTHSPPDDYWIRVRNVDGETVGYYNTESADLICQMIDQLVEAYTVNLASSSEATMVHAKHIWEKIHENSELVCTFDKWEERYDELTGSLYYFDGASQEFYWKPLKGGPAPSHEWHRLTAPNNYIIGFYNVMTHEIRDPKTLTEEEMGPNVNTMELNPTFLRECDAQDPTHGTIGKCWHMLDHSVVVAEKFGWQWRYHEEGDVWHFYDHVFSRYQWQLPKEWSASRYIRFEDGQLYDCQEHVEVSPDVEATLDINAFEVVAGRREMQSKIVGNQIKPTL